ncbi:lysine--tRNA ligase [Chloroflexota bacterium]
MANRKETITRERLAKLNKIRSLNVDPYPHRYYRTHTTKGTIELFEQGEENNVELPEVRLAGRITSRRAMGKATFIDLRDGYGKIQIYLRQNNLGVEKYQYFDEFDIGDFIGVEGKVFRTHSGEVTIQAIDITMLSKSLQPLPEKWHGLVDVEKRYRQRHLDLISNEKTRYIFTIRSRVIASMRHFLNERGFSEVETPVLLSVAAGAMAHPFSTHHQALDQTLYLRIATELNLKRLIIGGFEKVYEIGRIFRNEGISTKHNPEFTTLESYEAYADYNDVMVMVEEMISYIAQDVLGTQEVPYAGTIINLAPPWQRINLKDELSTRCGIDFLDRNYRDTSSLQEEMQRLNIETEPNMSWGRLLDKLVSTFVEPNLIQPTFVLDYPIESSPLAKKKANDPRLVERFEGFIGGMEVANAFTELNDPLEQKERFQEQEKLREMMGDEETDRTDEEFLDALEYGMPPTGGLGVGIDRLLMILTNQQSIREVILFPHLKTKQE